MIKAKHLSEIQHDVSKYVTSTSQITPCAGSAPFPGIQDQSEGGAFLDAFLMAGRDRTLNKLCLALQGEGVTVNLM